MSRWTNWLGPLDCTDNPKARWEGYESGVEEKPGEVYKETGYQIAAFLDGLIPMLMQVLIALAATTALGGVVGAAVGAFFGGAGAIPGAAIGAQAGFDLGVLILTWMGLAFLIEAIGHGLVELTSLLTQAVRRAWDAPNTPQSRQQIRMAGQDLARCGAILMRLILQGIVAWLSKSSVTGTFARSEASMGALLAELRKSKLGPQFTGWIEANIERLMSDPRLRPHRGQGSAAQQVASEAQSPSQLAKKPAAEPVPEQPSIKNASNAEKGVFGEAKADGYMERQGFEKLNGPSVKVGDAPKGQGIDGVWRNKNFPPPPEYVVTEAKYGSSRLGTLKDGTKQMSDKWVADRLPKAVGQSVADDIELAGYDKWLLRVDETGAVSPSVVP